MTINPENKIHVWGQEVEWTHVKRALQETRECFKKNEDCQMALDMFVSKLKKELTN